MTRPTPTTGTVTPGNIPFIKEQLDVIEQPVNARQYVEAGPGTGKTAVACERIAYLLRQGTNASSILIISFTRAAVREMKDRISTWAGKESVGGLHIFTIDQTAFRFLKGAGSEVDTLLRGYDTTMAAAVEELRSGKGELAQYVSSLRHVLVDEAQDLTDIRSEFVETLLSHLHSEAGATILADPCQGIYGFTHDQGDEDQDVAARAFLSAFPFAGYKSRRLTKLHRTNDKKLSNFFTTSRAALLKADGTSAVRAILDVVTSTGPTLGDKLGEVALGPKDLLLFRRRAQALHAAQWHSGTYRLRLPGYPSALYPWIALTLGACTGRTISFDAFAALWKSRVSAPLNDGWTPATAWEALRATVGASQSLDLVKLRRVLSQPRPPIELCYPDFGSSGPIFSTIHASKGREADRVVLMLPRKEKDGDSDNSIEEGRVYYVGATRVRRDFAHAIAATLVDCRKLTAENDREVGFPFKQGHRSKFQIGRIGDFADHALISARTGWCGDDDVAIGRQQRLIDLWTGSVTTGAPLAVTGKRVPYNEDGRWLFRYEFRAGDEDLIAWSGPGLTSDLFSLTRILTQKPGGAHELPKMIPYLKLVGLRSVAVPDPMLGELCAPYCESGMFLAPMIAGFASIYTQKYK